MPGFTTVGFRKGNSPTTNIPRNRQRGVILLLVCFSLPVMIGMMGLGIDVGIMYAIKARLQMSCDGAAVAALRSLSLAQTTAAQAASASSIADQWFAANFAGNYLGALNTSSPAIAVVDDNTNHIRTVTVSATTTSPTYFMKLWGRNGTLVGASGQASRRDVVIMMVLDRSNSMNNTNNSYGGNTPCQVMVAAAKQFTGMFQQNRDRIGVVTFAETAQIAQSPTTTFQTALGYTNSGGSGTGTLDNITCTGGTNTSTAVSLGWNELYKMQLPGALNALVVFTDGQPTAGTYKFVVPAGVDPTGTAQSAVLATSNCLDSTGKSLHTGGNMVTSPTNWISRESNGGSAITLGANSYWGTISGPVGALYGDTSSLYGIDPFFVPSGTNPGALENVEKNSTETPGCAFLSNGGSPTTDIAFVPPQDYFGNASTGNWTGLATSSIQSATRITVTSSNVSKAAFNLTDNAANWARSAHTYSNAVAMPGVLVYTIGLGGNGGVDYTLLQRMANDPNADPHGVYGAFAGYNTAQPVGSFTYSADASQLQSAFVRLASTILRISK